MLIWASKSIHTSLPCQLVSHVPDLFTAKCEASPVVFLYSAQHSQYFERFQLLSSWSLILIWLPVYLFLPWPEWPTLAWSHQVSKTKQGWPQLLLGWNTQGCDKEADHCKPPLNACCLGNPWEVTILPCKTELHTHHLFFFTKKQLKDQQDFQCVNFQESIKAPFIR